MSARDDLAAALLAWRKTAGLTQDEAGPRLGVDASTLSKWENGQLPKPPRAADIARVYGIDHAEVSVLIAAAWEEDAAEAHQALGVVTALSERVEMMYGMMLEMLRRTPEP